MMASVDLYCTIGDEVAFRDRLARGRVAAAGLVAGTARGDRAPGRLGEDVRAPARADLRGGGAGAFPPMTTEGVLGAAYLPTDGYIDPSQLTFALAEGARSAGAEIVTKHAGDGDRDRAGRVTGSSPTRAIEDVVVNAGGMFAPSWAARGRDGADRADGARVPRHAPSGLPLDMPTASTLPARVLPARTGRPDHGRLRARSGAVVARRDPTGLQREAARGGLGPASSRCWRTRSGACPRSRRWRSCG